MPSLRARSLMELVTVTRATTATYCGADGLLALAAAGVARIDHDPVTRAVRGLLVEEARTNLLLRSQEIDNAAWTKAAATCAGAAINAAIAPDGTQTMDKLEEDNTNSSHYCSQSFVKTSSTEVQAYALSVWARAGERSWIRLVQQEGGSNNRARADFDLVNGIANAPVVAGNHDSAMSWIENWGGGLYRCCLTFRINNDGNANTTSYALLLPSGEVADGYAGTTGFGAYLWGFQLEKGAFPTSYIGPTTTAAVTRVVDDIRMASLSPWLDEETVGTLIAEYSLPWTYSALEVNSRRIIEVNDGSATNRHLLYITSGDALALTTTDSVAQALSSGRDQPARNVVSRAAWAWQQNDFAHAIDGTVVFTDSAGSVPAALSAAQLGLGAGGSVLCGHLRRLRFYPRRVANTELQQLTKAA